ncbi:MAG: hypothetical protein ACI9KE_005436 [Polyangiales bacterium]|jgi:hypothetical protein
MSNAEKGSDAVARRPLLVLFLRYKEKLAFLVLIAGLLLIGREISSAYPRDVDIVFELGPAYERHEVLEVRYLLEGEEVRGATYRGDSLDETIRASVSLSPGRYSISAHFNDGTTVERVLQVPAEGRVHISLYERGSS